jgi:hypothetical protein
MRKTEKYRKAIAVLGPEYDGASHDHVYAAMSVRSWEWDGTLWDHLPRLNAAPQARDHVFGTVYVYANNRLDVYAIADACAAVLGEVGGIKLRRQVHMAENAIGGKQRVRIVLSLPFATGEEEDLPF